MLRRTWQHRHRIKVLVLPGIHSLVLIHPDHMPSKLLHFIFQEPSSVAVCQYQTMVFKVRKCIHYHEPVVNFVVCLPKKLREYVNIKYKNKSI